MKKLDYKKEGFLILGVNGWFERGHDASAALIEVTKEKCKIIAALEEEKVTGIKCSYDRFPIYSIKEILEMTSLTADDIDEIAFGWNYPQLYEKTKREFPFNSDKEVLNQLFPFENVRKKIPISYIDHHLAHAASTFRVSRFNEALVVVVDGNGEDEACSIWYGNNENLLCVHKTPISSSFGFLFEATNLALGFKVNESGKTMGLAAYGRPEFTDALLNCYADNSIDVSEGFERICKTVAKVNRIQDINAYTCQDLLIKTWLLFFKDKFRINILDNKIESFHSCALQYKNLAASVQLTLEEKITSEIVKWMPIVNTSNLCIAGGVGLNCTMNGKILALKEVERIFVQPAAGDAGVSLGSALERARQLGYKSKTNEEFSAYLGTEWEDSEIIWYLKENNVKYKYYDHGEKLIAEQIASENIVALFQGRNEWGPRALGNRSIISRPTEGKLDIINQRVKRRELGRPLAPSMLAEDSSVLNSYVKDYCIYMNVAYKAEKERDEVASILHVDKTYRPQYVTRETNILYDTQLREIKKQINNSIVINTSFNNTTPIVYSLKQAIELYKQRTISMMVFNNRIIIE